ncbi:MAG: DUF1761 domain-containing protein [Alphaproteobacteria bacterium]
MENLFSLLSVINYWAVLVAALVAMLIAMVWYHPKVMGSAWMAENNFKEKDLGDPIPAMMLSFVANLILAFGLASFFIILQWTEPTVTTLTGAFWGFGLAVLIHGAAAFPNYVFEKRSPMLFLIHISNSALGMAAMGAILAYWK